MGRRYWAASLWAIASVCVAGKVSAAEPSEQPEAAPADEIIVTAQRRAESIRDVPMSIQAFSGNQLKSAGVSDASGLALVTSGLNYSLSASNTPIYTLRGIGFNTPSFVVTSPVGAYFDEVAYPYSVMSSGPIYDIQRVEVLKGPQGTLYGRNTTGGLINFIPVKPGNNFSAGAAVEIGNYETYNFEGHISAPLAEGVGVRLAGRWENSDKGWQVSRSRPGDRLGEKDRLGLRGILSVRDQGPISAELTVSYWRDKSDTVASQASGLIPTQPAFLPANTSAQIHNDWKVGQAEWNPVGPLGQPYRNDSRFLAFALRSTWAIDDSLQAISLTSYNDLKRSVVLDKDGTTFSFWSENDSGRIKSFSQELRLVKDLGGGQITVGGYYARDKLQNRFIFGLGETSLASLLRVLAAAADPANTQYTATDKANGFQFGQTRSEQINRTASAFANAEWKLSDRIKLTGGIRYSSDQLKMNVCSADYEGNTRPVWNTALPLIVALAGKGPAPNNVAPNGCLTFNNAFTAYADFVRPTLNQDNLSGRIAIDYQPNRDTLLYASASRGFKSGSPGFLASVVEEAELPARQEKVTAFEMGTKLRLLQGRLDLSASAYYYLYDNKQLFTSIPDPVFNTIRLLRNIPRSRVYGSEVELVVKPVEAIRLNASVSYTNSRITNFIGFNSSGNPADFKGSPFNYTPKWQVQGGAEVRQPLNEKLGMQLTVNTNYQSSSNSSLDQEDVFRIKSYGLINASMGLYTLDNRWDISVWARNLTNSNYWTGTDRYVETVIRLPGAPRTFGVSLRYEH